MLVAVLVVAVGGAPFVIRDAVRAVSPQFGALPVLNVAAPLAFLAFIIFMARLVARGPIVLFDSRPMVRRWLTDGALFALAMAALLLCAMVLHRYDSPSFSGLVALRMRDVVVPVLSEEIAFRGFLTVAIAGVLGTAIPDEHVRSAVSILLASAAFTLAHQSATADPSGALAVRFVAGLTFGLLTLHSRSLVPAMFAHAAVNAELLRC